MIRTIVIENEKQQSDYLITLLVKHFPEVDVLKICNSVPDGIKEVNSLQPDLIFLDVELPPYTGFDLLEQTRIVNCEVIFTTSFNKYAAKAFRFCALDFIEKPFGVDELKEAINRYKTLAATGSKKNIDALLHNVKQTESSMLKVGIPVIGGIDFVTVSEIILCKAEDNCTDFHLTNKRKVTATKTLKWVDELMREHHFFRVHDSFLINLNHIKKYKKGGEGGVVELTDQKEADVSRRRKDDFLKALSDLKMIFNK
ncbi:MAG: LytTR family DNA-binding domain-containing protein [Bacteroidota bacterium]